jgi:hypothetical protein
MMVNKIFFYSRCNRCANGLFILEDSKISWDSIWDKIGSYWIWLGSWNRKFILMPFCVSVNPEKRDRGLEILCIEINRDVQKVHLEWIELIRSGAGITTSWHSEDCENFHLLDFFHSLYLRIATNKGDIGSVLSKSWFRYKIWH